VTADRSVPHGENREASDLPRRLQRLAPPSPEPDYERLTAYAFARGYAEGKTVADVSWGEIGRGSRLLGGTAARVVGITNSVEAAELASAAYPAPNASYQRTELPALPHPDDTFDVVVAFGVVENLSEPEDFLREAGRVLRRDGTLLVSVPDKAYDARSRGGMYAPEAEDLLMRHFGTVSLYRHGAVAGGFVGPYSTETRKAGVQSFRSSAIDPSPGREYPAARSVLAVCGETDIPEVEPFLLLDRDGRVFDEHEDLARDVGLMWEEVDRMQQTEAQAFQDTLNLFKSEVSYLRARVRRSEARAQQLESERARFQERLESERARFQERLESERARFEERFARLQARLESQTASLQERIRGMENSATWRVFEPYRQLRSRIAAARSSRPEKRERDQ
jgi:cyclopropane fatty-acyl-phospholipid synthase-like methyltransferase